jgi:hypothetical protein
MTQNLCTGACVCQAPPHTYIGDVVYKWCVYI